MSQEALLWPSRLPKVLEGLGHKEGVYWMMVAGEDGPAAVCPPIPNCTLIGKLYAAEQWWCWYECLDGDLLLPCT